MGTKRQKTAEGHHLSRVKAQRNRAIAPTSVLCQWPEYAELGFRCQVHAAPQIDWESMIDRRALRFLAQGTGFAHIAIRSVSRRRSQRRVVPLR